MNVPKGRFYFSPSELAHGIRTGFPVGPVRTGMSVQVLAPKSEFRASEAHQVTCRAAKLTKYYLCDSFFYWNQNKMSETPKTIPFDRNSVQMQIRGPLRWLLRERLRVLSICCATGLAFNVFD